MSTTVENLKDFLWQAPRLVEHHCCTVAVFAGTRVAVVIRSWCPEIDLMFTQEGFYPELTDDQCHELIATFMEVVEKLVEKVDVQPWHEIHQATQEAPSDAKLDINQINLEDLEDSSIQHGGNDGGSQLGGGDLGASPSF